MQGFFQQLIAYLIYIIDFDDLFKAIPTDLDQLIKHPKFLAPTFHYYFSPLLRMPDQSLYSCLQGQCTRASLFAESPILCGMSCTFQSKQNPCIFWKCDLYSLLVFTPCQPMVLGKRHNDLRHLHNWFFKLLICHRAQAFSYEMLDSGVAIPVLCCWMVPCCTTE